MSASNSPDDAPDPSSNEHIKSYTGFEVTPNCNAGFEVRDDRDPSAFVWTDSPMKVQR